MRSNYYLNKDPIPSDFFCPLTHEVMQDPLLSRYGHSYERHAILTWLQRCSTGGGAGTCPLTRRPMSISDLVQNRALKYQIKIWHRTRGLTNQRNIDDDDGTHNHYNDYEETVSSGKICYKTSPRMEFPMIVAVMKNETERKSPHAEM